MNFSILSLELSFNGINDIGAASLASALEINSTLTALDICDNPLGDEGRMRLMNALIWNQTLISVELGGRQYSKYQHGWRPYEEWIFEKNQSLYTLLLQLSNKWNYLYN